MKQGALWHVLFKNTKWGPKCQQRWGPKCQVIDHFRFDTRRSPIHYVGLVQRQNGTEFTVKFFRRSQRHAPDYAFVEPLNTDIGDVDLSSLKGVLPSALPQETSSKRLKDILQFAFVFDNFNMQ